MRKLPLSLVLVLSFAASVAHAQASLVYDDGQNHVLDSLEPLQPDPGDSIIEVRDSPGGAATSLDVAVGQDEFRLNFDIYGTSSARLLSIGYGTLETFDDSTAVIEAGSLDCCSGSFDAMTFLARDRSRIQVNEEVYFGTASGDSTVTFLGTSSVFGLYRGIGTSTTLMFGGGQIATQLSGSATMTVFGGRIGLDGVEVRDDAHLIIDGGGIGVFFDVLVRENGRIDIHSDPFGSIFGTSPFYRVTDSGLIRLHGSGFTLDGIPVTGDLRAPPGGTASGRLVGTLDSGGAFDMDVIVEDVAVIRVVPAPAPQLLAASAFGVLLLLAQLSGSLQPSGRGSAKA